MRGTILIFEPTTRCRQPEPTEQTINGPPLLDLLKAAIGGGYIELFGDQGHPFMREQQK